MSKTNIRVGTIGFPVNKKRLYPHVDTVEIMETYLTIPKPSTAARWRDEASGHVSFSLQIPRYLFEVPSAQPPLPGELAGYGGFKTSLENLKLFERTCKAAKNLGAHELVLLTPVSFTPAKRNRDVLREFLLAVPSIDQQIVWQPSGPWDLEQAAAYAASLGLVLALDPLRDEPQAGDFAYFRLGPFAAMGSRVGVYDLERLRDAAARFSRTTIVFGTPRALDDARNLKKILVEDD